MAGGQGKVRKLMPLTRPACQSAAKIAFWLECAPAACVLRAE